MDTVHDFHECLKISESAHCLEFWSKTYQKAFPDMIGMHDNNRKNDAQYQGVDRLIVLKSTKVLLIDEKIRTEEYDDILLEHTSNDRTGAPGWINKNLTIDYLAYGFIKSRRCYLFPWEMLRRAWLHYGDMWIAKAKACQAGFRPVRARNAYYVTLSIAVPTKYLMRAVAYASVIQLDKKP